MAILAAALLFVLFGHVFLMLFLGFSVAALFGVAWIWMTLGFAAIHFVGAFICTAHVRKNFGTPVFKITGAELKEDIATLTKLEQSTS